MNDNNHIQLQQVANFFLKGKEVVIHAEVINESTKKVKKGKYRVQKSQLLQIISNQNINDFLSEIKHFVAYLNNVPFIDELYLNSALHDRCLYHIVHNGRLIDADLSGYADSLLLIYEAWNEKEFDFDYAIALRSRLIRSILNDYKDFIFINIFQSPNSSPLLKYEPGMENLTLLLGLD